MKKAVTAQLICMLLCVCTTLTFINGQTKLRCCPNTDRCPWTSIEDVADGCCADKGWSHPEHLTDLAPFRADSDDSATRDSGCRGMCCKVCQSLSFLPSNGFSLSLAADAQPWMRAHLEPASGDYPRNVYRPPRS
jgi:hypothetical protein